jgi:hypothetical protein
MEQFCPSELNRDRSRGFMLNAGRPGIRHAVVRQSLSLRAATNNREQTHERWSGRRGARRRAHRRRGWAFAPAADRSRSLSTKFEHETMSPPPRPSPSTERTRRYRQRRRRRTRCITVEMNESEISALVTKGYLADEARSDPKAIKAAIEALISDLAFELEQQTFRTSGSRS